MNKYHTILGWVRTTDKVCESGKEEVIKDGKKHVVESADLSEEGFVND